MKRKRHFRERVRRNKPVRRRHTKTVVHIPVAEPRPWDLNREEVELVKKQICPGATDEELKFCLTVARRNRLDPFKGQIWFIPRGRGDQKKWVPIVGINGLRHIAARDHRDYGSVSEPEYGPMITVTWTRWDKNDRPIPMTLKVPEWARVVITKKGCAVPTVGKVFWEEIYPNIDSAPLVRQMPRHMIAKCAEANGQRKAYPSTDGLYIKEEFAAARPDYTAEGREIIYPDEPTYARRLDDNAPHGHRPGSDKAKIAEAQLAKVEAADKQFASGSSPAIPPEGHASNAAQGGKTGGVTPPPAAAAPTVSNSERKGILASARKLLDAATKVPQGKPSAPSVEPSSEPAMKAPQARIPHKITEARRTSGGKGVEVILDTGHRMFTFHNTKMDEKGTRLFDLLMGGVGKMLICSTHMEKNYFHIDRVYQLGSSEWDEEGIPVLRRDAAVREPGEDTQEQLNFKP